MTGPGPDPEQLEAILTAAIRVPDHGKLVPWRFILFEDEARAACYNELDKYVTTLEIDPNGLVVLPLTQKPSFYGYTSQLATAGVAPDAQGAGPLTNVADFSFAG